MKTGEFCRFRALAPSLQKSPDEAQTNEALNQTGGRP
jgi:hypothetical protein